MKILGWWSGGITSAVACKLALNSYEDVTLVYIETGSHHNDTMRFKRDCEKWYGKKIITLQSKKFDSVNDVILSTKFINSDKGARCTTELKREVRKKFDRENHFDGSIWGFEYTLEEIQRAEKTKKDVSVKNPIFPLIQAQLNKKECAGLLVKNGIDIPMMYKLGYNNNNCVGCVKGGMGYWNKIRIDFPEEFNKMALAEREINHSCLHNKKEGMIFLDTLDPKRGDESDLIIPECGFFCQNINL